MTKESGRRRAKRGLVREIPPGKTRITIRIDNDVIEWFKDAVDAAGGGSYQAMMNRALRDHISSRRDSIEATLRRVLREELPVYRTGTRR
jgi:uncharacterized protein (DUF4415 family)